jgi:hypothetical protein
VPLRRIMRPDGSTGWIRKAYALHDYAVPAEELARLRSFARPGVSALDELDEHDGAFQAYVFVRRVERDGRAFVVLRHPREWAIEVELTRDRFGEIRPVPPGDAWQIARACDTHDREHPIDHEGEPPPSTA